MSLKVALLSAAALAAAAGCSLPYATEDALAANVCTADSDCPEGSVCAAVGDESTCVSGGADLSRIVFEVRPAPGSGLAASSLVEPDSLPPADSSQLIDYDIRLPAQVNVAQGQVFLPCADNAAVPAKVTFQPVPGIEGLLEGQTYVAESVADDAGNEAIEVDIPEGLYDLYIQPHPDPAVFPGCTTAPPMFLPGWDITSAEGLVAKAEPQLVLDGTLKLSQKEDFTKWFIEVVEPLRGQIISQIVQPEQVGIALEVPFQVAFDWTARSRFTPIIRLRPPQGSGKPVIHWSLDAVALLGIVDGKVPVTLDVSSIDTQPRPVDGQVLHDSDTVPATVTLRSMSVSKVQLARYETVVETDANGHFEAALPPGVYQVIARPHEDGLALGVTTWDIDQDTDCFCGNSVQVPAATTLAGSVSTPSGDAADVEVRLTPAATGALPYLGAVSTLDVPPRPASTFARYGQFKLSVDPGLFDLSIITPRDSGYPWLVRPNQPISGSQADGSPTVLSLEPFELQNPVVIQGTVRDPGNAVLPGATIRAWIEVGASEGSGIAPSAVQIGETIADENGAYVLLLPPSIK